MKDQKRQIAIAGGSFIAGVAVGIASKEFFKRICSESFNSERADAILELKNQQKEFMSQMNRRMSEFRARVKKELHEPIPDLYKATEGLSLDERDIQIEH